MHEMISSYMILVSFRSFPTRICVHEGFVPDHDAHTKKGKAPVIHKDIIPLKPELEYPNDFITTMYGRTHILKPPTGAFACIIFKKLRQECKKDAD